MTINKKGLWFWCAEKMIKEFRIFIHRFVGGCLPGSRKGGAQQVTLLQPASGSAAIGHARHAVRTPPGTFLHSKLEGWRVKKSCVRFLIWMDLNGQHHPTSWCHWCHHSESYNNRGRDSGPSYVVFRPPGSHLVVWAPSSASEALNSLWFAMIFGTHTHIYIYIYTQYTW